MRLAARSPVVRAAGGLRVAAVLVLGLALVGVVVGVLWWHWAPVATVRMAEGGGYLTDEQPEQFIAADGLFALLTGAFGLVAGWVVAWRARRERYAAVVGLAVGGAFGAVVAWRTGVWLGRVDLEALRAAPVGTVSDVPLALGLRGLLLVEPVAALAAWLALDVVLERGAA